VIAITDNVMGLQMVSDICTRPNGEREGNEVMTELFLNAFFAVRGFHGNLLERARTERGASMVEYALLVGLIAVVAVVAVAALGGGISKLFSNANSCVGGLNSTTC
jgi:pilus assembly protein Flp/PilA